VHKDNLVSFSMNSVQIDYTSQYTPKSITETTLPLQVTWLVITEVRSESFMLITERCRDTLVLCAATHIFAYWTSFTVTHIFSTVECGIARFLCTMRMLCVYSTFGHHPHPTGYRCAKFRFCCGPRCWASPWRKIAYSILTKSLTHPAYLMAREPNKFKEIN